MEDDKFKLLCSCIEELVLLHNTKSYKGKCFQIAFETSIFLAEKGIFAKLVHSNIHINDKILGHAWIEYYNVVIDLTLEQDEWIQDKDEYYKIAKVDRIIKYSMKEIQNLIIKNGQKQIVWNDWIIYDK